MIIFLYLHNHLKINNLHQEDIIHIQIFLINHNISHEYHHIFLMALRALKVLAN